MHREPGCLHVVIMTMLVMTLTGCRGVTAAVPSPVASAEATATTLNVFAAASLIDAFDEVGKQFEAKHPGVTVAFNYAGSNQLARQIIEGAPADVFASANVEQMELVSVGGQVAAGSQRTFARNRLVVVYPRDNPAQIMTLKDLATPGVKIVVAASEVPAGKYALDFLGKASRLVEYTKAYSETVLANVVSYEENVRAVLNKVILGEADAGIVYTSDIAFEAETLVGRLEIPDALNTVVSYPIAPIAESKDAALARLFVEYVLSPDGQTVLRHFGFIPSARSASAGPPAGSSNRRAP